MHVDLYEKIWIALSLIVLTGFLGAIAFSVFDHGIHLPGVERRLDPAQVTQEPPFSEPGLREVGPGLYEAYIVARLWSFTPPVIRLPVGATVTFHVTSPDVVHGFGIHGTNVNLMVLPGYVATATATFSRPGEYLSVCHEYCGIAHQVMAGKVIVEQLP